MATATGSWVATYDSTKTIEDHSSFEILEKIALLVLTLVTLGILLEYLVEDVYKKIKKWFRRVIPVLLAIVVTRRILVQVRRFLEKNWIEVPAIATWIVIGQMALITSLGFVIAYLLMKDQVFTVRRTSISYHKSREIKIKGLVQQANYLRDQLKRLQDQTTNHIRRSRCKHCGQKINSNVHDCWVLKKHVKCNNCHQLDHIALTCKNFSQETKPNRHESKEIMTQIQALMQITREMNKKQANVSRNQESRVEKISPVQGNAEELRNSTLTGVPDNPRTTRVIKENKTAEAEEDMKKVVINLPEELLKQLQRLLRRT